MGLGGSSNPRDILAKAQLLLKSGAITQQQFEMIMAKLQAAPPAARPGAPAPQQGASPLTTTGVPGGGPPMGGAPVQGPSPQWNM